MHGLQDPSNYESLKSKLSSAAIVGHTTATTARLWTRVYRDGLWHLLVSHRPLDHDSYTLSNKSIAQLTTQHPDILHASHTFSPSSDLTHTFEIDGLLANTRYYYYLVADNDRPEISRRVELGGNHDYWFRTLAKTPASLCFGFYSCHDPFSVSPSHDGAWSHFLDALDDRKADFVIGGGDQVYCDTNDKSRIQDVWQWLALNKNALIQNHRHADGSLDKPALVAYFTQLYRTYYRIYWNFENVLSVYRRYPQYMIWDDHEIMDGWGSLTEKERKLKLRHWLQDDDDEVNYELVMLMFEAAAAVYEEYQHCHNPGPGNNLSDLPQCQWDYTMNHGEFAFFVLDVRGHHDCEPADSDHKLLGRDQMARFRRWINAAATKKKKALFVVSPVPMVHWNEKFVDTADFGSQKDDFMDEWGHSSNHAERRIVLDLLLKRSHESGMPITILSGDVHCASAFRIRQDNRFPGARLFNLTSSAISRAPAPGLAVAAMQKSANIDGYEGGRFEQLYRFAGENNFALINADVRDGELSLSANLFWAKPGRDSMTQKVIWLHKPGKQR
ncbi:alkaline phosphatase D family protein [Marinobacter zhejiangensis]|uniref:Alkaline phosphatase D n=1 Tax=Marinobacter zhejiangensis TaxID=488535 RepID=A0A1I4Q8J6_9GAMM|nr:alkaline phosphatase D family protein [Marinobacter zhejiangensis]SFM35953.1 alkaline phosphatase D [Marinobacter zhejiangensis]